MILGIHGNPYSTKVLGSLRRIIIGKADRISSFSMGDMKRLADQADLKIVDSHGLGYLPHIVVKYLPFKLSYFIEKLLADKPLLRKFGKNLIVVCKKKDSPRETEQSPRSR